MLSWNIFFQIAEVCYLLILFYVYYSIGDISVSFSKFRSSRIKIQYLDIEPVPSCSDAQCRHVSLKNPKICEFSFFCFLVTYVVYKILVKDTRQN